MASTCETNHYKLYQRETDDPVLREDFNQDNLKIDEVLGRLDQTLAALQPVFGIYSGTGRDQVQTIRLNFAPSAVIVFPRTSYETTGYYGAINIATKDYDAYALHLKSDGFTVTNAVNLGPGNSGITIVNPYCYFAWR